MQKLVAFLLHELPQMRVHLLDGSLGVYSNHSFTVLFQYRFGFFQVLVEALDDNLRGFFQITAVLGVD